MLNISDSVQFHVTLLHAVDFIFCYDVICIFIQIPGNIAPALIDPDSTSSEYTLYTQRPDKLISCRVYKNAIL